MTDQMAEAAVAKETEMIRKLAARLPQTAAAQQPRSRGRRAHRYRRTSGYGEH